MTLVANHKPRTPNTETTSPEADAISFMTLEDAPHVACGVPLAIYIYILGIFLSKSTYHHQHETHSPLYRVDFLGQDSLPRVGLKMKESHVCFSGVDVLTPRHPPMR